ncbi:GntR family transcriptional regulator [Rothia sp. AR01]|uniref:GntR family transcriptional regulator n=1 Tax=Rothia santali TaxID=2949643 RepID=A0A9X2KM81_9MICC|nr:GntR family transcriptional regulator [Rothia santali]MCP3426911.1 GntR family transcriptional regulator [Rothia santali]
MSIKSTGASREPQGSGPGRAASRTAQAVEALRTMIVDGEFAPGEVLREVEISEQLGVSRNTLRECFRLLDHVGLVVLAPYRGASVATPTVASILDIYRVRRIIEGQAILGSFPGHPAVAQVRRAVERGREAALGGDWRGVGSADIEFHRGIIQLADSPRLTRVFAELSAELRLAFGVIDDPEYLHAPFLELNGSLLELLEAGEAAKAQRLLESYLQRAERVLVSAYERRG